MDLKPLQLLVVGSSLHFKIPKPTLLTPCDRHCQPGQEKLRAGEIELTPTPQKTFQLCRTLRVGLLKGRYTCLDVPSLKINFNVIIYQEE